MAEREDKMADNKQNKSGYVAPKADNGEGKSFFSNFLSAITLIKKEDHFNKLIPKLEEWLKELSELERELIIDKLGKIKPEEAVIIIKTIIGKGSNAERCVQVESLGLLITDYDIGKFNEIMLDVEESDEAKAGVIDSWLSSLDPKEASYFRLIIVEMDPEISKKIIISLAKIADDLMRTNRAKARNLLP